LESFQSLSGELPSSDLAGALRDVSEDAESALTELADLNQ
jgi:hypothetical protein